MAAGNGNGRGPKQITKQQRDEFLDLVRGGKTRPEAATALGLTGTRFRSLCNQDTAFGQAYEEARAEGRGNFQESLRTTFQQRALAGEGRVLWQACVTYLPECAWGRRNNEPVRAEEGPLDFSHLDEEQLDELCDALAKAVADRSPNGLPSS